MATIIAGRFDVQDDASAAVSRLVAAGFPADEVTSFFTSPAGRHGTSPIGGDRPISPGAGGAAPGATSGAVKGGAVGAAVGIATVPILGPAAAVAGAAVGAYTGSLAGGLNKVEEHTEGKEGGSEQPVEPPPEPRPSGMLAAVAAPDPDREAKAVDVLRAAGAADIERAEGTIKDGDWTDFFPAQWDPKLGIHVT